MTRVIQWATGPVGAAQLREIIDDPDLELAGVFDYSPGKVGVDAGTLVGRPPTGVIATNDKPAILALDADLVLHSASKAYGFDTVGRAAVVRRCLDASRARRTLCPTAISRWLCARVWPVGSTDEQPELSIELNRLIQRRTRVALGIGLATVAAFTVANHARSLPPPLWTDVMNVIITLLIGIAFAMFTLPVIERRPVPFAVLVLATGCGLRALGGVWHGDVAPTAITLVGLALISAATLPWGLLPQIAVAGIAGGAIALNSYFVDGNFGPPSGHAAVAVALGLAVSVVLAVELQRHCVQLLIENVRRRQAEESLTQLNAELEQRVMQRTAQLDATTRRLEHKIQDHEQAVEEMRESQRRLQGVLDHAMAAIYLRDAEGRYVLVNRHWEALAERRAEDVVGKSIDEVMPSETVEALRAHDRMVLELSKSIQFEETVPRADGVHTYVSVKFPQFDRAGRPVGVWGISTDITERKRAEEQARQHQADLAHVLRLGTMGEMAAGLAHEINQPLGAVANYARGSVLRLRSGSLGAVELLPIMEAIAHEALRAGEIIRRVRDLVRKEPSEQKPVDLNALVRDSAHFVEGEARQHGIRLELDLAAELRPVVCNGVQIEQVLLNLLRNAVEAVQGSANGDGHIVIATAPAGRDAIALSVRDNGVGLPEPSTDVFAPFYSTKTDGLGMGLSISRSIIEAHRGHLWAVNNPDRGSTFHFTLPLADPGEEAKRSTASPRSDAEFAFPHR
jgi:PAS domain S-box-containing protein